MAPVTIKCAPAVEDRTVETPDNGNYEESWEAVLFEKKAEEERNEKVKSSTPAGSASSKVERGQIIEILQNQKWDDLINKVKRRPQIAYIILSNVATTPSKEVTGNYVLHEAVRYNPPLEVVEVLISAHESALQSRGNWGYLPLHYACTSGASADVVEALLEKYPNGAMAKDSNDHMLPLHLACKAGAEADVLMALLTSYPEATTIKDDFGQTPLNYGRNIRSRDVRSDTLSCLEIGKWLRVASTTAKTRATDEFDSRLKSMKMDHEKEIDTLNEEHSDEKARLMDFIKVHEMNGKDLENKLSSKSKKLEEVEQKLETDTRGFKSELEGERKKLAQTEVALDVKIAELKDMTRKMEEARLQVDDLEKKLEDAKTQHDAALEEIDTLTIRLDNTESLMSSIRQLASQSRRIDGGGREHRDPAPTRRIDKFREKALKMGKKTKDSREINKGASKTPYAHTASKNLDLEKNNKSPLSGRVSPVAQTPAQATVE